MTRVSKGGDPGYRPVRRLRFDGYPPNREAAAPPRAAGLSGRRVVLAGILTVLGLWGSLSLLFRDWRARYRIRADFGARQVATAIDPLAAKVPPDVPPAAWRRTVQDAHAMIVTLTASNLLGLDQMRDLRAELAACVARARPETARAELAQLWNSLVHRAGPNLVKHHPRPKLLDRG